VGAEVFGVRCEDEGCGLRLTRVRLSWNSQYTNSAIPQPLPPQPPSGGTLRDGAISGVRPMAKNGFRVFDSDMHIMEPPDLWERYIDPEFRDMAPRGLTSDNVRDLGLMFPDGEPDSRRTRGTPHFGRNYERNQQLYRHHS